MRPLVALLVTAACLHPRPVLAQDAYAAILLEYLSGDSDAAVSRMVGLNYDEIKAGIAAFDTTRSRLVLTGAAAMHTEASLRPSFNPLSTNTFHLQVATAIVEFGERTGEKTNTPLSIKPQHATPVSDSFRVLWYCSVINSLEGAAKLSLADKYLAHALKLYPKNTEIALLAGVAEEMRASPRISSRSAGDRRRALGAAEKHYRVVLAGAPDRLEARLRLGRVLQQRNELVEARSLLTPLTSADDLRIAYLARLFLGGIEDESQHGEAAFALYDRAAASLPMAQTARLAASELRHRSGDRQAAADDVPAATGADNSFDPWWTYIFGEYWRDDILLNALRGIRRA